MFSWMYSKQYIEKKSLIFNILYIYIYKTHIIHFLLQIVGLSEVKDDRLLCKGTPTFVSTKVYFN